MTEPSKTLADFAAEQGVGPIESVDDLAAKEPLTDGEYEAFTAATRSCRSGASADLEARIENAVSRTLAADGWHVALSSVAELLRASDDGAVVMSYSVEDGFPNPKVAGFAPTMPDGWRPDGWSEQEWAEIDYHADYWDERVSELWGEFDTPEQWRRALNGLRARPAANLQIQPNGGRFHFGPNITVFDLLADDRDTRLDAAFADYDAALGDGRAEE